MAYGFAVGSARVRTEIIDTQPFPEMSRKYRVSAIPKTLFNYDDALIGTGEESEMLGRVMRAR